MDTMHIPEKEKLPVNEEFTDNTPQPSPDVQADKQDSTSPENHEALKFRRPQRHQTFGDF